MDDEQRLNACLTLYKQQMEHYHKTQDVEWKGTFGAWTFGVAMLCATLQPTFGMASARRQVWTSNHPVRIFSSELHGLGAWKIPGQIRNLPSCLFSAFRPEPGRYSCNEFAE